MLNSSQSSGITNLPVDANLEDEVEKLSTNLAHN